MATHTPSRAVLIRGGVVLFIVFGLLRWAGAVDLLSGVTKPLVLGLLGVFGVHVADAGPYFMVGELRVPWTGDCAGANILALLVMLSLWVNRAAPLGRRHLVQLALSLPLAFVANLARIFTLIGYRVVFYPQVETAQLHYLIGFLWVLPVLPVLLRGGSAWRWIEVLHVSVVLALLVPLAGAPGGTLVAACALMLLANGRPPAQIPVGWISAWVVAALLIALTHMESLWLPWMLSCPALIRMPRSWRWVLTAGLLLGTISVLALHMTFQWIGWAAVAVAAWDWLRSAADESPAGELEKTAAALRPALATMLLFPFVAVSVSSPLSRPPPPGLMARQIEAKAYEVHLLGQSPKVEILWFEPQGDGRHHTLAVCMRYRGVELEPVGEAGVMTDGRRWMREIFLQNGRLARDYSTYLRRTFLPLADPGVHVIVIGDAKAQSAAAFLAETDKIAGQLAALAEK